MYFTRKTFLHSHQNSKNHLLRTCLINPVLFLICILCLNCESKEESNAPVFRFGGAPKARMGGKNISKLADELIDRIGTLEKEKDVVCWTSFRQLDQFIATREYSETATLTKVEAQKSVVRSIWKMASSDSTTISRADIEKVIGKLEEQKEDIEFQNALRDYRTTSNHWRIILSVLMDDLAADHVPKHLDNDALDALGEFVLRYSIILLKESGRRATELRNPYIEPSNIVQASEFLAKKFNLKIVEKREVMRGKSRFSNILFLLTEKLITKKIEALNSFNTNDPRAKLKPQSAFEAINLIAPMPIDRDAFDELLEATEAFSDFATSGQMPTRSENYLSGVRFITTPIRRYHFVDAIRMERITRRIFPHQVEANGDVELRFEAIQHGLIKKQSEAREVKLLDHQQNAVRDSALHWSVLASTFRNKKFSLDPFAAEILSETVSMMLSYFVFESARIAAKAGHKTITFDDAKKVRDGKYTQVRPKSEVVPDWTDEEEKRKRTILSKTLVSFTDISQKSGFPKHGQLNETSHGIQAVMGSGMASGDIDNDGDLDLFVAGIEKNILYLNDGKGNFTNVNTLWGIPENLKRTKGVLFADWNGDGKLDLFIIRSLMPSILLEQRAGKFVDVTKSSGFKTGVGAHVVHAFDFDNDDDLDIYVGYYGADSFNSGKNRAKNFPTYDGANGTPNQLFEFEDRKYTEVAAKLGVNDRGWALAIIAWDFDHDGDRDIYIANDFGANVFLKKEGEKYIDISRDSRTADRGSGMNISLTDVNEDGFFDFYIANIDMFSKSIKTIFPTTSSTIQLDFALQESFGYINGNRFYISEKPKKHKQPPTFSSEEKKRFEPKEHGWSWGTNFFDADNDGDEDVYLANGWIEGSTASNQANQFFIAQNGFFYIADQQKAARGKHPLQFKGNSRSVITQDFDRDGKVDVVVNNFRGAVVFFKNTSKAKGNWVRFSLKGKGKNAFAVGAVITVKAGKKTMNRILLGGDGYLSQHSELHFGLGKASNLSYVVRWANGQTTKGVARANEVVFVEQD